MRVVVAVDKFRGSLSAAEAAARVAAGLREARPEVEVLVVPVADGGEGTLDAVVAVGGRRVPVRAAGPLGEPVQTSYAVVGGSGPGRAIVELADACGLARLPPGVRAPLTASSRGAGDVLAAALDAGCRDVVLAVGGSASTDGGTGLLRALGARWLDAGGHELPDGGGALTHLAQVDLAAVRDRLGGARVVLASDVDAPLLGPSGAAAVYGPQKGASPADVAALEAGLRRLVDVLAAELGPPARTAAGAPGAGAAGGVGYAALAVLGAERHPGVAVVLDLLGGTSAWRGADLVVTGEGSLDASTVQGKAVAGVAAAAAAAGVRAVAVAGRCTLPPEELGALGVERVATLAEFEPDPARSVADAGPLLQHLAERVGRELLLPG